MTEQEALDSIPDDWAQDIAPAELEQRAKEVWPQVVFGLAQEQGIRLSPTDRIEKVVMKLAKAHGISRAKELAALKDTCLQNARIDVFKERYGHLFEQDEDGELSYSLPMLKKISGLPL